MSDYKGRALVFGAFGKATALLADSSYDADWFGHALAERGRTDRIRLKPKRKTHIPHDTALYRQRHGIQIMFGKLKDWRRSHPRYELRPHVHVLHLRCSNRHLLAAIMSPEPSTTLADFCGSCVAIVYGSGGMLAAEAG